MLSTLQAVILGLIQGFSELFPISSLGHSVIIPSLLGWNIHQGDGIFLTFLVATHIATATVLFIFFWQDWVLIFKGLFRSLAARKIEREDTYAKLGWLLVVGTIPAGILGLLFEQSIRSLLASSQLAAMFLIINGFILLAAEALRKNRTKTTKAEQSDKSIARLTWSRAVTVGSAQAAALFPGISRSGSSMAGGLLVGLNNEDAARFSFLLATPIIGAAALLKLPQLFSSTYSQMRPAILIGSLCSAIGAYLSVRFLLKFFQSNTLKPFAIYCLIAGSMASLYFLVR